MAWRIPGYLAEEIISYGGSGEVWRGKSLADNSVVALKRLRSTGRHDQCLYREITALSTVDHPNIVRMRDVVKTKTGPVLVFDFADGGSLAQVLFARGRLSSSEVISIVVAVGSALTYLHSAGLVHADVTPGNILFSLSGRPQLTDFGVAHLIANSEERAWFPAATAPYADPVVMNGGMPGPATDVFMLAACAFQALTNDALHYRSARWIDGFSNLDLLDHYAPAELSFAMKKALTIDPGARGTADELSRFALWSGPSCPVQLGQSVLGICSSPPPPAVTCPLPQAVSVQRLAEATGDNVRRRRWNWRRQERRP